MSDLIAFLEARLDEDEAYLRSNERHLWTQRPLREVEDKRAIVAAHQDDNPPHLGPVRVPAYCLTCDDHAPCPTLRHLGAVYSDHPNYRPEWKP